MQSNTGRDIGALVTSNTHTDNADQPPSGTSQSPPSASNTEGEILDPPDSSTAPEMNQEAQILSPTTPENPEQHEDDHTQLVEEAALPNENNHESNHQASPEASSLLELSEQDASESMDGNVGSGRSYHWQSNALRIPVLLVVCISSLVLACTIQVLCSISQKQQGIIFADSIDSLPFRLTFAFTYLPTILATIYAFVWGWIDLDVKRLEPFYQLSRKQGALGADSLLLDYPVDFIPFVPFKSLVRRYV